MGDTEVRARMRHGERPEVADALIALLVRALGLSRAALLVERAAGEPFLTVASHGRVKLRSLLPDVEPGDGPWSANIPIRVGERTVALLLLSRPAGAPLEPEDGTLVQWLVEGARSYLEQRSAAADLTHARELLARADRLSALGTLAAGVAHEIRNPLVSVRTFIQLIPERIDDDEFRNGFRDLALKEIERICTLINDLLAFSRPSPAQLEPCDLNDLAQQTVRLLEAEGRKRDVVVRTELARDLPLVVADEARVKQVLMNVVLNAIQAGPQHSTVEVGTRVDEGPSGRWSVVEVADSGAGISAADAEQIFDPFFTTKDAGSGLGLFIAHRIITEHGGTILTRPREAGGTVFSVLLPVAVEAQSDAG